jgi:hypothetical protein
MEDWAIALTFLAIIFVPFGCVYCYIRRETQRDEERRRQQAPIEQAKRDHFRITTKTIHESGMEGFWKAYGRMPVYEEFYHAWYPSTPEEKARLLPYLGQYTSHPHMWLGNNGM